MSDVLPRIRSALEGRYAIAHELGHGGMATVYLATDAKHDRQVAVKVLDPEVARGVGSERFLQEIRIAARLAHPNILPLHDSGESDGFVYYVMPYVEGDSLRARLVREGHLGLDEAVRIVGQVSEALDHAHREGVVHRDIKPENILLAGGQAVVTDFGIARAIDVAGSARLTETGLAVGTPAYMSPEQSGARESLDGRSDVYSLGCVAYEMLGGEPPFTGASPLAVMARHAVDPVPPLRTLRPGLPRGVAHAIERALAKIPADRFATAGAFANELAQASSATAIAREEGYDRRIRRRRVAALGSVALLIAVGVWWGVQRSGASRIRRFAVLPFPSMAGDSSRAYFADGLHEELIAELAREGLGVIARTSVMQYRNTDKPVRAIARELGVDAVIELPSLERTADSVSIQVGLVDGHTEQYLWNRSYAGDDRHVPALTRDIAEAIARVVRPGRPAAPGERLAVREVDPQVYDAYLRGRSYLHRRSREDLETSRKYFELALTKDSTYAPAWAGISMVWAVARQRGYSTPQEATPAADSAAFLALRLDSTLAEPHYALALGKVWGHFDWEGGEREFERAVQLSPDDAEVRVYYAHLLAILHRPRDAVREVERARELDPLDVTLDAAVLAIVGHYDDAIALYRDVLTRSPDNPGALRLLWVTLHSAGRYQEARAQFRKWAGAVGGSAVGRAFADGEARGGYRGGLEAVAEYQAARPLEPHADAWNIAVLFSAAGDRDQAIEWLRRSFQKREPTMPYLGVYPSFAALHDDQRFRDLVRQMNLPTEPARSSP
jgi:TolB-like protein/tetratricopeptide (TPR) repeat protein